MNRLIIAVASIGFVAVCSFLFRRRNKAVTDESYNECDEEEFDEELEVISS